jgi:adenylate cyclase
MNTFRRNIIVGLISGCAAILFSLTNIGELAELKGYDLLHLLKRTEKSPVDIVIIAIDEPSFAKTGLQWPWPRSLHARLVDVLKQEGASVIGFDVIFSGYSNTDEDADFGQSLKKAGNVCLASDVELIQRQRYAQEMVTEPIPILKENSFQGIVAIQMDRDAVVRKFYPVKEHEILFAKQVARLHSKKEFDIKDNTYIFYTGPPDSFTTVSYYQALDPSVYLPPHFFSGKIVLIGKISKNVTKLDKQRSDVFATPFLFSSGSRLMSGVEIQANMVFDFLHGTFITRMNRVASGVLLLIIGIAGSFLQIRWKPVLSGILTILLFGIAIAVSYYVFHAYRIWTPTGTIAVPLALAYTVHGIHAFIQTEKMRRKIKRVFSHAVSPAVLETVLKNPEKLKLGGVRAEVTILFSDIAGFTRISEKLQPEEVGHLINRYFDEMTRIVLQYRGTIDKFIGDAVMAFWGAPLPDEEQSLNACRAAIAMQVRMTSLRAEIKREGLPEITTGIGVHTGPVIAGNMGSSELFSYTVMGDTVNVASRLESANKELGTSVLISKPVFEKAGPHIYARSLGKIPFAGKTDGIEVFELLGLR